MMDTILIKQYATTFVLPLVCLYTTMWSSQALYDYHKCSRIDKIGSVLCENSHTAFVVSRKYLVKYIHEGFGFITTFVLGSLSVQATLKK